MCSSYNFCTLTVFFDNVTVLGVPTTVMGIDRVIGFPAILTPCIPDTAAAVATGCTLTVVVLTCATFRAWALLTVCMVLIPVLELTTNTCWFDMPWVAFFDKTSLPALFICSTFVGNALMFVSTCQVHYKK